MASARPTPLAAPVMAAAPRIVVMIFPSSPEEGTKIYIFSEWN
jgi:hypothetical protein